METPSRIPTQSQMFFPTLTALKELGGEAHSSDVIAKVAEIMDVPAEVRDDFRSVDCGKWGIRWRSVFRQNVHWVRQNAVMAELLTPSRKYGYWTLSEKGRVADATARPGLVLTVYETSDGQALWADVISAAGVLSPNSVDLVFTSPMYPFVKRGYGCYSESEVVELIVRAARFWKEAITDQGSIVLNFKDVWLPKAISGGCARSLYQERIMLALCDDLKLHMADKFIWKNSSHLPDNPWVTVRKVRTNCDHENLFWFSKSPNPYADNRSVLVDAAPSTIEAYLRKARRSAKNKIGPSGHNNLFEEHMTAVAAGQAIKVIPRNVLEISNGDTHRELAAALSEMELPRHDAMMPVRLAEHFIKFLTKPGQLVHDPFFGSGTTGVAARNLGRQFLGSDASLGHVLASAARFTPVRYADAA